MQPGAEVGPQRQPPGEDTAPAPGVAVASAPVVSVVVPTVDREHLLDRCLRGLAGQSGVDYEVIVVHEGTPATVRVLQRWTSRMAVRTIVTRERSASVKRNLGWRAARAHFVAFTDDDCEPAGGWLVAALAAFTADVDIVQGRVGPHPEDAGVQGTFARTVTVSGPDPFFPNANLVYRRTALQRAGGYDPRVWGGGEDTDLAWRVRSSGGGTVFAPDALVWHAVRAVRFRAHLRSLPRWMTIPLVVKKHPGLRQYMHRRVFWKRTHPLALLAVAGLLAAPAERRAALLAAPLLVRRVREAGAYAGTELAVSDVIETIVLLWGSARYRSLLL